MTMEAEKYTYDPEHQSDIYLKILNKSHWKLTNVHTIVILLSKAEVPPSRGHPADQVGNNNQHVTENTQMNTSSDMLLCIYKHVCMYIYIYIYR